MAGVTLPWGAWCEVFGLFGSVPGANVVSALREDGVLRFTGGSGVSGVAWAFASDGPDGSWMFPHDVVSRLVKPFGVKLADEVSVDVADGAVMVTVAGRVVSGVFYDSGVVTGPSSGGVDVFIIDRDVLVSALAAMQACTSDAGSVWGLVHVVADSGTVTFEATDRFRLGQVEVAVETFEFMQFAVSRSVFAGVAARLPAGGVLVSYDVDSGVLSLSAGGMLVTFEGYMGDFPKLGRAISEGFSAPHATVTLDRAVLVDAVGKASRMSAATGANVVRLEVAGGEFRVVPGKTGGSAPALDAVVDGGDALVPVNPAYFTPVVAAADGARVRLSLCPGSVAVGLVSGVSAFVVKGVRL